MAKKRNYENDEAYKNFRLEDYLPSMNRREPEAKISEPEQDTATEETALFPPLDAPDISAIQAAASETIRPDGQDVQEDEAGTDDADEEDVEIASVETEIPVKRTVTGRISSKQRICCDCHGVGNQDFFGKTYDKSSETFCNFFHICISVVDLFLYVMILYNGPSNELREKGNIEHHIPKILLRLHFSAINVNHIGQCLKGKERNTDGQSQASQRNFTARELIYCLYHHVQILEHHQKPNIDNHRNGKNPLPFLFIFRSQQSAENVVYDDAGNHQQYINRFTISIKQQTDYNKQYISDTQRRKQIIKCQYHRQKNT